MVGRIRFHQSRHPNPWSCESVTLHGRRNFQDVIKVKDSETRRLSWIIRRNQSNHESLKEDSFLDIVKEQYVTIEQRSGAYNVAGFADVRWVPWAKECRLPLETGKDKKTNCPLEPPERNTEWLTFWSKPGKICVRSLIYQMVK